MTDYEAIPIAPPMLGDVLASPVAYAEAMIAGQTLSPFIRVGSRRGRRIVAVRVAVAAAVFVRGAGRRCGTGGFAGRVQARVTGGTR
jgi:hypothetical protein